MKKQPVNRRFLVIIGVTATIALLAAGFSYFRYKSMHRSWNKTNVIFLEYSEPLTKSIYWDEKVSTSGEQSVWSGPTSKDDKNAPTVRVFTTPDDFRDELIPQASKNSKNKQYVAEIGAFVEVYTNAAATPLNDLIEKMKTVDGTLQTNFAFYVEPSVQQKLIANGKIAIYDTETNQFFTTITFTDKGFLCGPLCGNGSTKYTLPNGKIIRSSRWIS
jgi:hypothetical protein